MDHKACSCSIATAATAGTDCPPKPQTQEALLADHPHPLHCFVATLTDLVLTCTRAAALALATYTFALTAWRARSDPGDLAFVVGAYAALAVLLLCLRGIETLEPGSSPQRRWLHAAVWTLTAALSCAFAYRVSLLLPPALVALVWCMTSFVVILGLYLLVLSDVDGDTAAATGDGEPLLKKTSRPTDEIV